MDFTQITRDEFIKKHFSKGCPINIGLKNDLKSCVTACGKCWSEAIKDIKFKDDLEPNKDLELNEGLFEAKTTLTFKTGFDELAGKPIKFIGDKETGKYMYALIIRVANELMEIRCASGSWMTISAERLAELDPTILDMED